MIACIYMMIFALVNGQHAEGDAGYIACSIMYIIGLFGSIIFYYRLLYRIDKLEEKTKQK